MCEITAGRIVHLKFYMAIGLICFGSMAADAAAQRRAPTTVDRIRDMKTVVVQIGFVSDAPQADPVARMIPQRAGTGFFVSKRGYVLTAGHVIRNKERDAKANGASKVTFEVGLLLDLLSTPSFRLQGSFQWTDASVVDIDDLHDLALLKLSQNPFTGEMRSRIGVRGKDDLLTVGVARLDAALPPEGDDVLISGYPLEIPTFVTQKGMVASETFSFGQTQPPGPPAGFVTTQSEDSILLDAVVNPGNTWWTKSIHPRLAMLSESATLTNFLRSSRPRARRSKLVPKSFSPKMPGSPS